MVIISLQLEKISFDHQIHLFVWRSNGYENQGKGYGKALIDFLASKYADEYSVLQVGTGDSPLTVPFYEKCGFVRSHNIPNFFTDNYDHPIYECGVQLIDMVYLQRCYNFLLENIHSVFLGVPSMLLCFCVCINWNDKLYQ